MAGPGRPTLYKPEHASRVRDLCARGATNPDLATPWARAKQRGAERSETLCHNPGASDSSTLSISSTCAAAAGLRRSARRKRSAVLLSHSRVHSKYRRPEWVAEIAGIAEIAARSVDRRRALVAIGPAHVGRQGEGDLAVVVARRRAELERLEALAAQFDVVHSLHALIAPLDDPAGEGIGRPAFAQPHVLGPQRHACPVADAERLRRPGVDTAGGTEIDDCPLAAARQH